MSNSKTFGKHTAKELAERLKKKEDLKSICLDEHMPAIATARKWIKENKFNAFKNRPGANKGNGGRPTSYSVDLEERIMMRVLDGDSLATISLDSDMPGKTTLYIWLANNNDFRDQYDRAIDIRDSVMREEIFDIIDNSTNDYMEKQIDKDKTILVPNMEHINRSKMRAEYRFKIMCKTQDKYKDKQTFDINSTDLTPTEIKRVVVKKEKK